MSDSDTNRDSLPSINAAMSDLSVNAPSASSVNKPNASTDAKIKAKKGLARTTLNFIPFFQIQ